jgi:hypothetical protein
MQLIRQMSWVYPSLADRRAIVADESPLRIACHLKHASERIDIMPPSLVRMVPGIRHHLPNVAKHWPCQRTSEIILVVHPLTTRGQAHERPEYRFVPLPSARPSAFGAGAEPG